MKKTIAILAAIAVTLTACKKTKQMDPTNFPYRVSINAHSDSDLRRLQVFVSLQDGPTVQFTKQFNSSIVFDTVIVNNSKVYNTINFVYTEKFDGTNWNTDTTATINMIVNGPAFNYQTSASHIVKLH